MEISGYQQWTKSGTVQITLKRRATESDQYAVPEREQRDWR
jgi:hypothetical protein